MTTGQAWVEERDAAISWHVTGEIIRKARALATFDSYDKADSLDEALADTIHTLCDVVEAGQRETNKATRLLHQYKLAYDEIARAAGLERYDSTSDISLAVATLAARAAVDKGGGGE